MKKFFALYLVLGLVFIFVIPPFQKADETVQFRKTVSIASFSSNCRLPRYLFTFPDALLTDNIINSNAKVSLPVYREIFSKIPDRRMVYDSASCPVNGLPYIPTAVLMSPLVNFGVNPFVVFYAGRLINFLIFSTLLFVAVKMAPEKFLPLLVIFGLLPMVLNQAASYSKDFMNLGFAFIFFSLYLDLIIEKNKNTIIKQGLLLVSMTAVIATRLQYAPIIFLVWPFTKPVRKLITGNLYLLTGCVFIISLLFFAYLKSFVSLTYNPAMRYIYPLAQARFIIGYPAVFFEIVWRTITSMSGFYLESMIGVLGWLDFRYNAAVYYLIFGVIMAVIHYVSPVIRFNRKQLINILLVTLLIFLTELASFYIYVTPVGNDLIAGLQGRYFIVAAMFLSVAAAMVINRWHRIIIPAAVGFIILVTLSAAYLRYFDYSRVYFKGSAKLDIENMSFDRIYLGRESKVRGLKISLNSKTGLLYPHEFGISDENCDKKLGSVVVSAPQLNSGETEVLLQHSVTSEVICVSVNQLFDNPEKVSFHIVPLNQFQ